MFEKIKDVALYEEELRKIKREHFARVNDLETENHQLKQKLKEIEVNYEQQILTLKHQINLEKERIEMIKEKKLHEAEKEISREKDKFSADRYSKMESLLEKEKDTLRTILNIVVQRLPEAKQFNLGVDGNINGNLLTGSTESETEDGSK